MRPLPALLAGVLLLVACGGSDATTGTTANRQTGTGASTAAPAQVARGVKLESVGRFDAPLYVTGPPGDRRRVFVVQQGGRIAIVRAGKRLARPFLDIGDRVTAGGEQGLLSMAFAPDYAQSGLFYVYYTEKAGTESTWEFHRASPDRADPASGRLVLRMDDPESNHNGGLLLFGPDRLLYVGTGDGGGGGDQHGTRGNAQDLGSPLGKILRIDPRARGGKPYTVPSSNPFVQQAGARPEIYSFGLRNPWRFAFDRANGDLAIGDVGQDAIEEIDFERRGRARGVNFGWRPWEGRSHIFDEPAPGAVFPVITHTHASGFCSITGGVFVRDRALTSLYGRYLYGDYCEGRIRAARLRAGGTTTGRVVASLPKVPGLSSFGEDTGGRVYVTSLNGPVYRFAAR
jgi:glucose/arabinose dehydrogenase